MQTWNPTTNLACRDEVEEKRRDRQATKPHERLAKINIELDQCWDLLRQRQAGHNPDEAHVRPPEIVENYEQ